jgi:GcrA cell cycle regulator
MSESEVWTEAKIETLRALWGEGIKTAEIGRRMHMTKSAVVGKAHRLNLPGRPSPIKGVEASDSRLKPTIRKSPQRMPRPIAVSEVVPAVQSAAARLRRCQFIIGEPRGAESRYCESPSVANRPYCHDHCMASYRSYRERHMVAA